MTSTTYVRLRDIPSPVLEIIRSSRRGEDISGLIAWGAATGSLSRENGMGQPVTRLHLQCDNCGAATDKMLYETRKALKQGSRDAYCSAACSHAHHAVKNSKPCPACGGRKDRHLKYCSSECGMAWRRSQRPVNSCPQCGTDFIGRSTYCSRLCADRADSDPITGANNSNFSGLGGYFNQ